MDHKTCMENLSAYLDGELSRDERALLENHLADCPECRNVLNELKSLSLIIHKHGMEPVPFSLKEKIFAKPKEKPAFYAWIMKPALVASMVAAGMLIVFNIMKNPEPMRAPLSRNTLELMSVPKPEDAQLPSPPRHEFSKPAMPISVESGLSEESDSVSAVSVPEADSKTAQTLRLSKRRRTLAQPKSVRAGYRGAGTYTAYGAEAGFRGVPTLAGASAKMSASKIREDRNHIAVSCKSFNEVRWKTYPKEYEVKLSPAMQKSLYDFSPDFKLRGMEEYSARILEHYCYSPYSNPSAVVGDFNGDGSPDAYLVGYEKNWLERILLVSNPAGTYDAVRLEKRKYDGIEAGVKACPWCYDKNKKLINAYYLQPKGASYICGGDYYMEKSSLKNDGIALLNIWEKGLYISYISIWDEGSKTFIEQHCILTPCSEHECR
jgi:hypothetical protein